MDDWSTALNELSSGQTIRWSFMGETEIRMAIDRQFSTPRPIVTVDDSAESGVSVRVVLEPGDGWVDNLRERLGRVRQTWPNQVVTTPRSRSYWQ